MQSILIGYWCYATLLVVQCSLLTQIQLSNPPNQVLGTSTVPPITNVKEPSNNQQPAKIRCLKLVRIMEKPENPENPVSQQQPAAAKFRCIPDLQNRFRDRVDSNNQARLANFRAKLNLQSQSQQQKTNSLPQAKQKSKILSMLPQKIRERILYEHGFAKPGTQYTRLSKNDFFLNPFRQINY